MTFTKAVKKRISEELPKVFYDEIHITPSEHETTVEFLADGKVVMTKRTPGMLPGDTLRLTGFKGELPIRLDFRD